MTTVHTVLKKVHDYAWVLSLAILVCILITIPLTIVAVENQTTANTQAATLACIPYPPCYYDATNRCALPMVPSNGRSWCTSPVTTIACGTIMLQGNVAATTANTQNAESCFWNAYQQCNTNSTGQNITATLNVVQNNTNSSTTTTYTTKLTNTNGTPMCAITYSTNDTSTCSGLTYSSQNGLQFNSCDSTGNMTIPPLSAISSTPSPSVITPSVTCMPRPACLNTKPACNIAVPANGWCPITPTPVANNTCQTNADCTANQVCVLAGPIQVNPTTHQTINAKHCYNKGAAIPL